MKISIFLTLFLGGLTSCTNNNRIATLLNQADSLLNSQPDSALTILTAVNSNDLSRKNNAYYSLLLTQAQYKLIQTIESDSIIDIAVQYYTDHFDREKLTRALMYKGAVLADLKYNRMALDCYKEAEKIADTTDYLTMGLLNTRLGELYQKSYIENNEDINRYKEALKYYRKINHKRFERYTLSVLGQLNILTNRDSALTYLNEAIKLSKEHNDSTQLLRNISLLSQLFVINQDYEKAKNAALYVINNDCKKKAGRRHYSAICEAYINLSMIDSATYYAQRFPLSSKATDTMSYYIVLEEIALAKNNYKDAYIYDNLSTDISDSLVKNSKSEELYAIDKQFDNQIVTANMKIYKSQVKTRNYMILTGICVFILFVGVIFLIWRHKERKFKEQTTLVEQLQMDLDFQETNQKQISDKLLEKVHMLNANIEQRKELEQSLKTIIESRFDIIRQLMTLKYETESTPERFIREFTKIISINKKSKEDCSQIIDIANKLYDNLILNISTEFQLDPKEQLLLSLVSLKFTPIATFVFLNTSTPNAVYVLRSRLSTKLGTKSLEIFLTERYENSCKTPVK